MNEVRDRPAGVTGDLVNRLTSELSEIRRSLADVTRKLTTTTRTLDGRTQELTEARTALGLLLATLDSSTDGIIAVGHFGRAMHYNTRFVAIWGIAEEKLPMLSDSALLTIQLTQVSDPAAFLARIAECKAAPDQAHTAIVDMTDGRRLRCHVMPHRVRGKRIGTVTTYRELDAA